MAKVMRCSDVAGGECNWTARGNSEEDIIRQAREHARTKHNMNEFTPEMEQKARNAIREEGAAHA